MTEQTYKMITRYGGIVVLVCVVACGYLVMVHWEKYRDLDKAEKQLAAVNQVGQQQQVYQLLLREFAVRMGKDQKIAEILQRNLGAVAQAPTPPSAPSTTPPPTKEPGATP